jgi:hypothetical protein
MLLSSVRVIVVEYGGHASLLGVANYRHLAGGRVTVCKNFLIPDIRHFP